MTETREYPYEDGDVTVLGPEVFASTSEPKADTLISWRGENFAVARTAADAERERVTIRDAAGQVFDEVVMPAARAGDEGRLAQVRGAFLEGLDELLLEPLGIIRRVG